MQNKNKARLLIFLIMLVIGSIIFFKYKNSSEKIYRNETPSKIREIKLLDNDKFVFVAVDNYLDDVILFGQNYITTFSSHTLDTTNFKKTPPIGSEEYFQIISYSVHGKEKIVKFNLYELLGKNNLYRFVHNFPRRYLQNDDDYLTMDLEKLNMYDIAGHDIRSVLVSASGEKVKDISESEMEKIDRERKLYFSPKYDWDRGGISEQIDDNLAKYHLSRFKRYSVEDSEKIISELKDKIGLRHKVAVRIVDLIPQDLSDLRLIFAKEATHIEKVGTVICCGGGVGVAPLLPIVEAFKKAGNKVITVLAARTKELIILEEQMRANSDEVLIMTDDGSYGKKGLITNGVEEIINREKVDLCVTIGPAIMMKFVSLLTKKYDIPTVASLNTIMVDGTGMCGACRITVGGKTKFVCVDGPEFDAHQVDFDEMMMRLSSYKGIE